MEYRNSITTKERKRIFILPQIYGTMKVYSVQVFEKVNQMPFYQK